MIIGNVRQRSVIIIEGKGQLAAGRYFAKQDVCNGPSAFSAGIPGMQYCRHLIFVSGQIDGASGQINQNHRGTGSDDLFYQIPLDLGKQQIWLVSTGNALPTSPCSPSSVESRPTHTMARSQDSANATASGIR